MTVFLFESIECLALVFVSENINIAKDLDDMPIARNITSNYFATLDSLDLPRLSIVSFIYYIAVRQLKANARQLGLALRITPLAVD